MLLSIDTSNADTIKISLDDKEFISPSRQNKSQKLLPLIVDSLKKENCTLKDLTQIKVHAGPGSFVGIRVGVSVANALGWALGIPVNGKNIQKGQIVDIKYD